jgi:hypothetical protein
VRQPPRRRTRWLAAAVLLFLGIAAAGVIYVQTDAGTLKIEALEDDVKVEVEKGGEVITVLDKKTGATARLHAGEYRLRLGEGNKEIKLDRDSIRITRGDMVVATITKTEAAKAARAPDHFTGSPVASPSAFFNGKDFGGWTYADNCWTIKDGALIGSTLPRGQQRQSFLCSERQYRDFELRFQVRLKSSKGNSGVQVRSRVTDAATCRVQGYQADIGSSPMGDNVWGSIWHEGRGEVYQWAPRDLANQLVRPGDFNDMTIRCVKKRLTITLNGKVTIDQDIPELPEEGHIAWQLHNEPMEATFRNIRFLDVTFDQWLQDTQRLSAQEQVKAVVAKLKELNPSFDGKVNPKIENGVVKELSFFTDHVTDISPVRALGDLQRLSCNGSRSGKGRLRDLSPLRGMEKLISLTCACNPGLSDLGPVHELPLKRLWCFFTGVEDLSPLHGMSLLTELELYGTPVSDLASLRELRLTYLNVGETQVSDLSPLRGMPLRLLIFYNTKVRDLEPLQEMSTLTVLNCFHTGVSDLAPLQGMKLDHFNGGQTKITDFSPLKDMPLNEVQFDINPKRDAAILRSIKTLETINEKPAAEFWKGLDGK